MHPENWMQPRIAMNMNPNIIKTYIKEYEIFDDFKKNPLAYTVNKHELYR